jgi:hypothetical protein
MFDIIKKYMKKSDKWFAIKVLKEINPELKNNI